MLDANMDSRRGPVQAMRDAARKAADGLLRDFSQLENLTVVEKGPSDFVSSADLAAQEVIRTELSKSFPDYEFILEEEERGPASERPRFLVDPLDGTTNFVHGIPHFAVSIGLATGRDVVAGVVLDVAKGELFWAARDEGAWLGDRRLAVSHERDLSRSIFATGIPHRGTTRHDPYLKALARVMAEVAGIRRFGAAALDLAYVAAGRFEAFFDMGLAPWDLAAGTLLVREAGGVATQEDGSELALERGNVLAANCPAIRDAAIELLAPLGSQSQLR